MTAERGGSRGRRDPALRQRIEQDQPIYDDQTTPDGVVGVRGPEPVEPSVDGPIGQVVNLNELTDEEYMDLVDRGLITDGDEGEVEIDVADLADADELDEFMLLSPGDVVYAKVHHPVHFDNEPSNFSYGVAARVRDGEAEEDAFYRIATVVNTRALNLAEAAMEPVMRFKDGVARARKEAINPGRSLRPREQGDNTNG